MKKLLLILLLLCGSLQAAERSLSVLRLGVGLTNLQPTSKSLTIIFDSPSVVSVGGIVFTEADQSVTIEAPSGETLSNLFVFVSSGGCRVIRIQ